MVDHTPPSSDNDSDPKLQIEQNLKGDRNQVIAQAIDSKIVNFAGEGQVISLTINDRVPAASAPPPVSVLQPLNQQEYRQRQVLLNKVREYWVKGVLEKSLHTRALIALGLQERLDLVQRPFSGVAEFSDAPGQALLEGTHATTVFEQMGTGRTLLILGKPGAGKTITLLKLAEDLIVRTESDLRQPIPVVFNLSSWAKKPQAIEQWLVQELLEKYQVSKALGKAWVETEALILLLDGLDEVKAEQRNACVQALNQFMQSHGTTEIAICCRIRDYQALADRLRLRSAICIQPLTPEQINSYFEQAGEQLSALKTVLQQDGELQELATSPLMLSIMTLAYQDCTPEEITQGGRTEDYHKRLFENYIDRMFQRRGTTQQYSREKNQRWLIWLAQRMTAAAQTMFLIERLQPSWLPTKGQRIRYRWESGFIGGLSIALIFGLIFGLIGLIGGSIYGWLIGQKDGLYGLIIGLSFGLSFGLIIGLIIGLFVGLCFGFLGEIKPVETLKWSWQEVRNGFRNGLIYGLIIGLSFGLIYGLIPELFVGDLISGIGALIGGSIYGLIIGLIIGLIYGLIYGFRGPENQQPENPNQGIFRSARNAVILGIPIFVIVLLVCLLIGGLIGKWFAGLSGGLIYGLIYGLFAGLIYGGSACIRHFALRQMLCRKGYAPWNYARFLDYATERLFLQKVGGGYIFVHRMLLEHFAGMSLEQGQR